MHPDPTARFLRVARGRTVLASRGRCRACLARHGRTPAGVSTWAPRAEARGSGIRECGPIQSPPPAGSRSTPSCHRSAGCAIGRRRERLPELRARPRGGLRVCWISRISLPRTSVRGAMTRGTNVPREVGAAIDRGMNVPREVGATSAPLGPASTRGMNVPREVGAAIERGMNVPREVGVPIDRGMNVPREVGVPIDRGMNVPREEGAMIDRGMNVPWEVGAMIDRGMNVPREVGATSMPLGPASTRGRSVPRGFGTPSTRGTSERREHGALGLTTGRTRPGLPSRPARLWSSRGSGRSTR